jgi:lysophospholipase L1-like esterase
MSFLSSWRLGIKGMAALAALGALASCGGGGLVVPFNPTRILAFGDELSVIESDGRKYTVNAFKITDSTTNPVTESTTELDCTRNPIWIQTVATNFALPFDRCLGTATAAKSQILAAAGAKVADLPTQLAAIAGAARSHSDLALVMIGMNDILELYAQYPATSRDALLTEARNRGSTLGNFVNALATSGPAVVVLTMPDIGLSPFALAENTNTGDTTRAAFISELVAAFNNRMSVTLINDGRLIGLAYADIETQNEAKFPSSFALTNVIDAVCASSATLPGCTTATLVSGATASAYLWADSLRLGPSTQARLGTLAQARARNNPF